MRRELFRKMGSAIKNTDRIRACIVMSLCLQNKLVTSAAMVIEASRTSQMND